METFLLAISTVTLQEILMREVWCTIDIPVPCSISMSLPTRRVNGRCYPIYLGLCASIWPPYLALPFGQYTLSWYCTLGPLLFTWSVRFWKPIRKFTTTLGQYLWWPSDLIWITKCFSTVRVKPHSSTGWQESLTSESIIQTHNYMSTSTRYFCWSNSSLVWAL